MGSSIHTNYMRLLAAPLCALVSLVVTYQCQAAYFVARRGAPPCCDPVSVPYPPHSPASLAELEDTHTQVEAALTTFFNAFQGARLQLFYLITLRARASESTASSMRSSSRMTAPLPSSTGSTATGRNSNTAGGASSRASYDEGTDNTTSTNAAAIAAATAAAASASSASTSLPVQPVHLGGRAADAHTHETFAVPISGDHDHDLEWHASETIAVSSFLFSVLRYTQTVLAAVDATCFEVDAVKPAGAAAPARADMHVLLPPSSSTSGAAVTAATPASAAAAPHHASPASTCCSRSIGCLSTSTWRLAAHVGLHRFNLTQAKRAIRVTLAIMVAALVSAALAPILNSTFIVWAPITCAFVSGGPDSGAFRTAILRITGTLVGASYGYLTVKITGANDIAIGTLLAAFVAVAQFARLNPKSAYVASVSSFTAAIVMLGISGAGITTTADALALERIQQTIIGVVIYVVVSVCVFPVSARTLSRRRVTMHLPVLARNARVTLESLVDWANEEIARSNAATARHARSGSALLPRRTLVQVGADARRGGAPGSTKLEVAGGNLGHSVEAPLFVGKEGVGLTPMNQVEVEVPAMGEEGATPIIHGRPFDPSPELDAVDESLLGVPELLADAAAEPSLWRPSFGSLARRYEDLASECDTIYSLCVCVCVGVWGGRGAPCE